MSKMRVHQIAKELGLASKDAVDMLTKLGVDVRNHASTIDDSDAAKLREIVNGSARTAAPTAPEPPKGSAREQGSPPAKAPAGAAPAAGTSAPPAPRGSESAAPVVPAAAGDPGEPAADEVIVPHGVTVTDFAQKIGRSSTDVIKLLMRLGEMKTITQSLSDDEVEVLANEFDVPVRIVSVADEVSAAPLEEIREDTDQADEKLEARSPVVTVMGHVDHGKSSILQQFRKKEMLSLEAGGITQAIGAYQVHGKDGLATTFIDTPGHEAFTQMRARGAQVTDIAILVVAADDGVQPQTVEALDHAKAAHVPVLVAVNKIDRPEADPTRVRQQLSELGLTPEEWGGDTVFVDVSAKAGTNLDQLLDMIHLVAELQELKANPRVPARGHAIEAHLDRGRGPVATLIVQKGTLRPGQAVVCGAAWARVRTMLDENGHQVPKAGPSQPVQVSGWSRLPRAGDVPELRLILKADTQGSLEALTESLVKMHRANLRLNILRRGVGAIGESDVTLAQASDAIVVGFGVRPDAGARQLAEREGVDVRTYQVIYQLLDDISQALKGLLAPEEQEFVLGSAQVRATFRIPRAVVA